MSRQVWANPLANASVPEAGPEVSSPTIYDLANLGRSLIPVGLDKKPLLPTWHEWQTRRPSRDALEFWGKQQPAGWAMITGAISGIITLDFDGDHGTALMQTLGLDPHRRTGRGGFHVDFVHPGWHVKTRNGKSDPELGERYPGLDIKADGGYAVVLGKSEYGAYEWLRDPQPFPLERLPDDMRDFLGLMHPPQQVQPHTANRVPHVRSNGGGQLIRKGDRHKTLLSLAGSMIRRGMGEAEIVAALLVTNQRCEPPYDEEHVLRLVADAVQRYAPTDAASVPEVPEDTDLFDREVPLRPEIIEGLVRESQVLVCGGTYGVGKSPLLQDLMLRVVHGLPWCGRTVQKRPIIYFDIETPAAVFKLNVVRMCTRLDVPVPTPDERGIYLAQDAPDIPSTAALLRVLHSGSVDVRIGFLREVLRRKPNAVVIIDPLEMFFRIEKRRETEVLNLYQELRFVLAEFPESAIITTWNLRKRDKSGDPPDLLVSPREWLEEVSGSIEIMNRSDVRVGFDFLQRDPEIRVLNGVRRGESFYPLLLRPIGVPPELEGFESVKLEGPDLCLAFTKKQLQYWQLLPRDFTFNEVADIAVPRSSLWYLLERARSLGLIREQGYRIQKLSPIMLPVSMNPDDFDDGSRSALTRGRKR